MSFNSDSKILQSKVLPRWIIRINTILKVYRKVAIGRMCVCLRVVLRPCWWWGGITINGVVGDGMGFAIRWCNAYMYRFWFKKEMLLSAMVLLLPNLAYYTCGRFAFLRGSGRNHVIDNCTTIDVKNSTPSIPCMNNIVCNTDFSTAIVSK